MGLLERATIFAFIVWMVATSFDLWRTGRAAAVPIPRAAAQT